MGCLPKVLIAGAVVLALLLGTVGYFYFRAKSIFDKIDRVDLAGVLDPVGSDGVQNFLVVGSDERDGLDGRRSDTIIVLHIENGAATMMSVPRDLWVTIAETDRHQKINAAYNGGPERLVKTVKSALGIPIHHYVEVTFASFIPLVNAMGGIELHFDHQAYDKNSGFQVPSGGVHRLDGYNALAYVRSRHMVQVIDGVPTDDNLNDYGRQARQQQFMQRVFEKLGESKNPFKALNVGSAFADGLLIDKELGFGDTFGLARALAGTSPKSVVLPTTEDHEDGQAILRLDEGAELDRVLELMR